MNLYIRPLSYLILFLLCMPFLHSQSGICPQQGRNLQMDNTCSNVSKQYKARDKITFSNGYRFGTTNGVMKAKLEETLIVPKEDYQVSQIDVSEIEIDKSLDVGLISGTGSVNLDGSASYNIPIGIPSGTAGLEPNLSIIYNSNLPNGMLGKGWTVSGISSINRISKTVFNSYSGTAFKGDLTGVNLNFNDFFSLDGNRLVLENPNDPSVYGNDNIIYRTFMESFVKIKSHGTAGNGPDWFEVFLPDGSIAEYGRTNNSKGMLENATTPLFWNINKVTDKHGNFMEFFYKVHNYEVVIEKVEYTGNNNANVSPYNTILFLYEEKQDKNFYYIGGGKANQALLLRKIKTLSDNTLINEYSFNYYYDQNMRASKLIEIEFALNGHHFNSTKIKWNEQTSNIAELVNVNHDYVNAPSKYILGDFNGNGKKEIMRVLGLYEENGEYFRPYTWQIYENTSSQIINSGIFPTNLKCPLNNFLDAVDINGDGIDELVVFNFDNVSQNNYEYRHTYYSVGNGNLSISNNLTLNTDFELTNPTANYYYKNIDFNGDGKADKLILIDYNKTVNNQVKNYKYLYISVQNLDSSTPIKFEKFNYEKIEFLDFNGNGKTDIMLLYENGKCDIFEYGFNNQTQTYEFLKIQDNEGFPTMYHTFWLGDFNGDGKTDILTLENGSFKLNFSTGNSWSSQQINIPLGINSFDIIKVMDYNGDGKDDILFSEYSALLLKKMKGYIEITHDAQVITHIFGINEQILINKLLYGDINGDGKIDIFQNFDENSNLCNIWLNEHSMHKNFVKSIYDGYKNSISFDFKPLTSNDVYNKICEDCPSDQSLSPTDNYGKIISIQIPMYVVSKMMQHDGMGTIIANQNFFYNRLKYNPFDRSLVGFSKVENNDLINSINNINYYSSYSNAGILRINQPIKEQFIVNNLIVSQNEYSNEYTFFSNRCRLSSSKTTAIDYLNGTKKIIKQKPFFDTTQNSRTEELAEYYYESVDAPESNFMLENKITKEYEYFSFCPWFANKLKKETTTKNLKIINEPNDVYERISEYTYTNDNNLQSIISDPYNIKKVVTSFSNYNAFGFACQTSISAPLDNSIQNTTNTIEYDTRGRFILKKTNSLNQSENYEYNNLGLLTSQTSMNGLKTKYYYNHLFSLSKIEYPDGIIQTTETQWENSDPQLLFKTTQASTGSTPVIAYYDGLGREIKTKSIDINNNPIYTVVQYNNKGLLFKQSLPFAESETPSYITYEYDDKNRNSSIENPDLSRVEYVYNPLEIITKQSKNNVIHTQKKKYNALGQLTESTDNNSNSVEYEYFASGLIKKTKILNVATEFAYDIQGNRTLLVDPSAGTITAEFDAFGRMNKQTKPNNLITLYQYDVLGRVVSKSDIDGTVTYQYDTKPNGKGKIDFVEHTNGTKTEFMYDNLGRTNQIVEHIGNNSFIQKHQYNHLSQLTKLTYPDNYDISYVYKNGNIHKIIETATSNVLWEAIDIDSKGNITQSKIGNLTKNKIFDQMGRLTHKNSKRNATFVQIVQSWDYQYDAMNNIKSRIDNVNFQRENFGYDNLNRLLEVHHGYLNQQLLGLVQSMNYDNLGNITFKTDVGNMQYSPTHPFQMEMLTENPQTITSEHVLEYFVCGRTKTIENNDKKLQFTYGSDLQRRKMEYFLENQLQSTTLYPFGNYEEVHNATTNDVLKYNYIGSPDGLIAIRKTTNGTSQLYYTLTDHLGSIDALCDENGSVVERYSYDAWGNRRNPSDWTLADIRTSFITNRGFTGHEHLDKFGLINANARMYEPLTGKFLAPDPYVQAPDYSQSFNRYTYCWNNPVKYTDPSGEFIFTAATLIAAPFTGGASLALLPYAIGADLGMWQGGTLANGTMNPLKWDYGSGKTWGYMLGGAAVGGASAGIGTSVTSSAGIVTGGIAGGALSGAGFGAMGGYAAELRGQDLFHNVFTGMFIGAFAGGMGSIVGGAIGGSWGAIAGGSTSNLTGQLISNDFSYKDIDWKSVGVSGITSLGIYHASSYANWKGNVKKLDFNGNSIKYNQYLKIQASYTRGKFWGSERAGGGFWLTKNGISRKGVSYDPKHDNIVKFNFSQKPSDAWATFHPHPYNESQVLDGNLWHSADDIENVNSKNFSSFIINKHGAELVTPNSTSNINFWNYGKPYYIYPWIWQ